MSHTTREQVILLHGLGETPMIMAPLEAAFRQAGYQVLNPAYPSTLFPATELAETYVLPLLCNSEADRIHVVTHSLGGVLLHYSLQQYMPSNLGKVVMTAPGLKGSEALETYRHSFLFRMIYGPAAYQSGTKDDAFAWCLSQKANYELGVIAGCISLDPVANLFIPWPHDGKISVERTKMLGMADHIVLPTAHDLIPSDPIAIAQALRFLSHGRFFHLMTPVRPDRFDLSMAA